jgi:hypothetical protein
LQFIIQGLREIEPIAISHKNVVNFKAREPQPQQFKKVAGERKQNPNKSGSAASGCDQF